MGTVNTVTASTPTNPLSALEAGELAIVLKPVFTLLANLQQPGANIETAVSGIPQVELEEAAQLPAIETLGINNVATLLQAKLAAWQASIATPAAPAA